MEKTYTSTYSTKDYEREYPTPPSAPIGQMRALAESEALRVGLETLAGNILRLQNRLFGNGIENDKFDGKLSALTEGEYNATLQNFGRCRSLIEIIGGTIAAINDTL